MIDEKKLKVLHLAEWYPNEDDPQLGVFIQKYASAVSRYTHSVLIYVKGSRGIPGYQIEDKELDGLRVLYVRFHKSKGILRILNFFRYRKAVQKAYEYSAFEPDLIHVHVPGRNTFFALRLKRKRGIPFFISEQWQGWLRGYYQKSYLKGRWIKKVFEQASGISVLSKALYQAIRDFDKNIDITIVPNIVETISLTSGVKKEKTILVIADLHDETKNISGIIQAFSALKSLNEDWVLHIIGDGPDRTKLEKLAEADKNIHFLGRKANKEVLQVLPSYSFFVSNSRRETFGVAIAEAIMAGIPVISTRCGGPEDFVNDTNGILVEVDNTEQLREAIQKMMQTYEDYKPDELRKTMQKFGAEEIGKSFVSLYREKVF